MPRNREKGDGNRIGFEAIMRYLLMACLAFSTIAFADDGFFIEKPYGNTVYPAKNSYISMVSETVSVVIDYRTESNPSSIATVEAIFNFENTSASLQNVLMGFPFNWPHEEGPEGIVSDEDLKAAWDTASLIFLDDLHFQSYVDGKLVNVQARKTTTTVQNNYTNHAIANWGTYTWLVNFAPKQKHRLISRYSTKLSEQVYSTGPGEEIFRYIARTGALWNGPIKNAYISITIPERFISNESMLIAGIKVSPGGYTWFSGDKSSMIQWIYTNWKPSDDFQLSKATQSSNSRYCAYEIIGNNYIGDNKAYTLKLICPDRELFKQSVYFDDIKEFLKVKRNEIYARKGYLFNDKTLLYYFGKYHWYKPKTTDVKLNSIEKMNISFIKYLEDSTAVFEDYLNN
jgi:hypothetical protein